MSKIIYVKSHDWTVDDWYVYLMKASSEFRIMGMDEQGEVCMDCVKCVESKSHADRLKMSNKERISSDLAYYAVRDRNRVLKERNAYNR